MNISNMQKTMVSKPPAQHDFEAVIKRSRGVADKMSKGVQFLMKKNKIDVSWDLAN